MEPILHNSCPQATHAHDGHAEGALSVGGQRVLAPAEAFIEVDAVREHMAEDNRPADRPGSDSHIPGIAMHSRICTEEPGIWKCG